MSAEDTITPEWYAPWPDLGKKLSEQLGEIRNDTAAMAPVSRGAGLDAAGNFSNLDGIAKAAVQSWEIGQQDFSNRFRTHYNKTTDVFEIAYNNGTTQSPNWYTTWWIDKDGQVTQQNTPTTASNVGGGLGWFKQKVGVDLEFKTITATSPITMVNDGNSLDVDGSALVSTYSSDRAAAPSGNANTGIEIILSDTGKVNNDLPFKALKAGPNVVIRNLAGTAIEIESTAQVVEFYGITMQHTDGTALFPEVHLVKVNVAQFYLTQQKSNPSAKEVILNFRGQVLQSTSFVAVIGDEMTGALCMFDGTESLPALTWSADKNTGIRRRAADDMAFVSGGADIARVLTDRLLVSKQLQVTTVTNDPATPDIFWNPDSDTGLYQLTNPVGSGDNTIAFATGGVAAGHFDGSQDLYVTDHIRVADGAAGDPTFSFSASGQQDVGMYRKAEDQLAFATGSTLAGHFDGSQDLIVAKHVISTDGGTAAAPSFDVDGSENSGIYDFGTDTLGFTAGGTYGMRLLSTGAVIIIGGVTSKDASASFPTYGFTSDTRIGLFRKTTGVLAFASRHVSDDEGVEAGFIDRDQNWTFTNELQAGVGSSSLPTYSFWRTGQQDMGMYWRATDNLGFAVKGSLEMWVADDGLHVNKNLFVTRDVKAGRIHAGPSVFYIQDEGTSALTLSPGSAARPSIVSTADVDTGIYFTGSSIVTSVNSVPTAQFASGATVFSKPIRLDDDATAATPALQFKDDLDTGIYQTVNAGNDISFATGGKRAGYFDSSQNLHVTNDVRAGRVEAGIGVFYTSMTLDGDLTQTSGQILLHDGSASAPAIGFIDQPSTGLYRSSSAVFIAAGGGNPVQFLSTVMNVTVPIRHFGQPSLTAPAFSFFSDTNTGIHQHSSSGDDTLSFITNATEAGYFDANQNLHVTNDLRSSRVEAGIGVFYTQILGDATNNKGAPAYSFLGDPNTGITHKPNADQFAFIGGGVEIAVVTSGVMRMTKPFNLRASLASLSDLDIRWNNDSDTGLTQNTAQDNSIAFVTGGTRAGFFDSSQNLHVTNDVRAGRVEAGIGVFYTSLVSDKFLARRKGTSSNVAFGWEDDPDTGFYREGAGVSFWASNGSVRLRVTGNDIRTFAPLIVYDGFLSTPSLSWASDRDTGFMQTSTDNELQVVTGGVAAGLWDANQNLHVKHEVHAAKVVAGRAEFYTQVLAPNTTAANRPAYSFRGDTDTGIYRNTINTIRFTTQGSARLEINTAHVKAFLPLSLDDDSTASAPALRFADDTNTGIFQNVNGGDDLAFATAGVRAGYFDANQNLHVTNDIIAGGDMVIQGECHTAKVVAGTGEFYEQVRISDGTISEPSISFLSNPDTGLFMNGNNDFQIIQNGLSYLRFTAGHYIPRGPLWVESVGTITNPAYSWVDDTNTGIYQVASGDNSIAFSTNSTRAGFFDAQQNLHITNTMESDRVLAEYGTFYSGLEFNGSDFKMVDGILYVFDTTRDKYLSISRTTLQYGRDASGGGSGSNLIIGAAGTVVDGSFDSGNPMPRDATITNIIAQVRNVQNANAEFDIFTIDQQAGSGRTEVHSLTVAQDADRIVQNEGNLNIDIDKDLSILCVFDGTATSAIVSDPILNVEIAWRTT